MRSSQWNLKKAFQCLDMDSVFFDTTYNVYLIMTSINDDYIMLMRADTTKEMTADDFLFLITEEGVRTDR